MPAQGGPFPTVLVVEEQRFNLQKITHLHLTIVPNKSGTGSATLTALRLFA